MKVFIPNLPSFRRIQAATKANPLRADFSLAFAGLPGACEARIGLLSDFGKRNRAHVGGATCDHHILCFPRCLRAAIKVS